MRLTRHHVALAGRGGLSRWAALAKTDPDRGCQSVRLGLRSQLGVVPELGLQSLKVDCPFPCQSYWRGFAFGEPALSGRTIPLEAAGAFAHHHLSFDSSDALHNPAVGVPEGRVMFCCTAPS
jgi:hypothetical protein